MKMWREMIAEGGFDWTLFQDPRTCVAGEVVEHFGLSLEHRNGGLGVAPHSGERPGHCGQFGPSCLWLLGDDIGMLVAIGDHEGALATLDALEDRALQLKREHRDV